MTVVRLEGSFGRWGQKDIQDKFRRCNLTRKGGTGLLDEQSYLTNWEKDHRDREKKEVAKKLGKIIMEGENILLIIQRIDMMYGFAMFKGTMIADLDRDQAHAHHSTANHSTWKRREHRHPARLTYPRKEKYFGG